MTARPHSVRVRLSDAERADLGRALNLTRSTPRGLLMTAVAATLRDVEAVSACVRAAEQRDDAELASALDALREAVKRSAWAKLGPFQSRAVLSSLRELKP
jgi:hypothetical protein